MKNQLLFIAHNFFCFRSFRAGWCKPVLSFFFIMLCYVTLQAQTCPPAIQWQESLGGSQDDASGCVALTADGGYIVAGYTTSNDSDVTGNHGNEDFWVVKLAADGSTTWQEALGGTLTEVAHAVAQTADGGYILAGASRSDTGQVTGNNGQRDFWIVKLDALGNIVWENTLGGSQLEIAYAVSQTTDGGYIVVGLTYSNDFDVTNNQGMDDYWVVKLDAGGNLLWQKTFGGTLVDEALSVEQTTDGGYIVGGVSASNNGDVTGNHGLKDYWLVKLDSTGVLIWQKTYGGILNEEAHSVQQTTDGGYIIAGFTFSNAGDVSGNHGNSDFWVVKTDSTGVLIWQKTLGGSGDDQANSIEQTPDGGYISAGHTSSNDGDITLYHGNGDYWVTKQDSDGVLVWQKILGGTSFDDAFSIRATPDTGYIVSGYSSSNNDDVTGNNGLKDFWVVKLHDAPTDSITYYADVDGDGYGDPNSFIDTVTCVPPVGYVTDNTDCNITDSTIHPNATELCNGLDENCNGLADDGLTFITYYFDGDLDTYGNSLITTITCSGPPPGYVSNGTDCNDANSTIHPNATEICNGIDENCNGTADDGLVFVTYYFDSDLDTYGDPLNSQSTCNGAPLGYITNGTDCNDAAASIHPGATEICNGIDENCNGTADDGLAFVTYYVDADDDLYGNPLVSVSTCDGAPAGYVTDNTDCNDANPNVNPGVLEVSNNGIDDNCNGFIDEFGVGIGEVDNTSSFIISPNPATSLLTLQLQLQSSGSFDAAISITNVLGEVVFEKTSPCINGTLHEEISIDKEFPQGIYLVQVRNDNLKWSRLLMIAK